MGRGCHECQLLLEPLRADLRLDDELGLEDGQQGHHGEVLDQNPDGRDESAHRLHPTDEVRRGFRELHEAIGKMVLSWMSMTMTIMESFQIHSCGLPTELASIPLVFEEPVYGNHELTFTDFMAPGIILTIVHSMALGYSAMIIIMERNEGLLDRTWVAGVTPGEFALAHFLVSLVVNLLQVIVTLVFMILVFQVNIEKVVKWTG